MSTNPDFNIPLAEYILRSIVHNPDEHDQSNWFEVTDFDEIPDDNIEVVENGQAKMITVTGMLEGSCGTSACVAGWAALLSGWKVKTTRTYPNDSLYDITEYETFTPEGDLYGSGNSSVDFEVQGREALGLYSEEAHELFFDTDDYQAKVLLYGHIKGIKNPTLLKVADTFGLLEGLEFYDHYVGKSRQITVRDDPEDLEYETLLNLQGDIVDRIQVLYPPLTPKEWQEKASSII